MFKMKVLTVLGLFVLSFSGEFRLFQINPRLFDEPPSDIVVATSGDKKIVESLKKKYSEDLVFTLSEMAGEIDKSVDLFDAYDPYTFYVGNSVPLSDDDLRELCKIKTLLGIFGTGANISETGAAELKKLTSLTTVSLTCNRQPITKEFAKQLSMCSSLQAVKVDDTKLRDEQVEILLELPRLQVLTISSNPITDRSLDLIAMKKDLRYVDLRSCKLLTESKVAWLRKLRPALNVRYNKAEIESGRWERNP